MTNDNIDWDAITREATDTLSRYVRIDSSHPVGRTVETAAFLTERLEAKGISCRTYASPEPGKVNVVARLGAEQPVGKPLLLSHHMDVGSGSRRRLAFRPVLGRSGRRLRLRPR